MVKMYVLLAFLLCIGGYSLAGPEKRDSGSLISDKRDVHDFHKILFSGKGNVYIQQGEHDVVQIVADESLLPYINTEVTGDTLRISEKSMGWLMSLKSFKPYNIYITVKDIEEMTLAGKGKLISDRGIKGEKLILNVSGSGKVECSVDVETLIANLTGSGEYNLKGAAVDQEIHVAGRGTYNAFKVLGKNASIDIRGYGDVKVNVQDKLAIAISGKGTVTYMGKPKITQKIFGTGKVEELH
jgi:hypothetical protein